MIKLLGVTGSIGMGKSVVIALLKEAGFTTIDSDALVGQAYHDPCFIRHLAALVPAAVAGQSIDKTVVSKAIQHDATLLPKLEALLHPYVAQERQRLISAYGLHAPRWIICDVPLLFETGLHHEMDSIAVASAHGWQQRQRVMQRPSMTEAKFQRILARQWPDSIKAALADHVIHTHLGIGFTRWQVRQLIRWLRTH